jgi:hypothetical protein
MTAAPPLHNPLQAILAIDDAEPVIDPDNDGIGVIRLAMAV